MVALNMVRYGIEDYRRGVRLHNVDLTRTRHLHNKLDEM